MSEPAVQTRWGSYKVGDKCYLPQADTQLFIIFTEYGPVNLHTGKKVNLNESRLATARDVKLTAEAQISISIK